MIFLKARSKRSSRTLSTREILKIQTRVERETGIRAISDIKANPELYIYHGILPAAAKDETDRDVFVKILLSTETEKRTQFERESWICSHFRHDHLIRKEFSRTLTLGGGLKRANMLVLEYIDGIDAAELLDYLALSATKLKTIVVIEIGIKILKALGEVHHLNDRHGNSMQIVHADVSPQNILLSRKGQVKLIDFGIARVIGDSIYSQPPPRAGKPGYIAPEQIFADQFDHTADLYAVGVVIAELIIGRRLATTDDLEHGRMSDLSKIYQERLTEMKMDRPLRSILLKAVHFSPVQRFANAKEFIQALENHAHAKRMVFHTDGISQTVGEVLGYFSDLETRQNTLQEKRVENEPSEVKIENVPPSGNSVQPRQSRITALLPYFVGVFLVCAFIGIWILEFRTAKLEVMNVHPTVIQGQEREVSDNAIKEDIQPIVDAVLEPKIENETPNIAETSKAKPIPDSTKSTNKTASDPKKPTGLGTLFVGASPWAEVTIPGYAANRPIPFSIKLSEGWHKMTARYQSEEGKWQYLSKSVQIKRDAKAKCLAFFDGAKRISCQ